MYIEVDAIQAEEDWILYRIHASCGRISTKKRENQQSKHWPFTTRGISQLTHIFTKIHRGPWKGNYEPRWANKHSKTISSDITDRLLLPVKIACGELQALGEKSANYSQSILVKFPNYFSHLISFLHSRLSFHQIFPALYQQSYLFCIKSFSHLRFAIVPSSNSP